MTTNSANKTREDIRERTKGEVWLENELYLWLFVNKAAVRIFTGAPVPEGAETILIQEDVLRTNNNILVKKNIDKNDYIRPIGFDFKKTI